MQAYELPLDQITDSDMNARSVAATQQADVGLMSSINLVGVLEPILVAPTIMDDRYMLVAGRRRLAACRALGRETIPAIVIEPPEDGDGSEEGAEAFFRAVSAAENLARAQMHPVDQWMAVKGQVDRGLTIERACAALGLQDAMARRFHHLARMHPDILAALSAEPGLPSVETLRTISGAPHTMQQAALKGAMGKAAPNGGINWFQVANGCQVTRIPRSRAEFDTDADTSVEWTEDLFAEPTDEDRFTTANVDAFLARQQEHLEQEIAQSKGRVLQATFDATRHEIKLPAGWARQYGEIPKRFAKGDERRVYAVVVPDGYQAGTIQRVVAVQVQQVGSRSVAKVQRHTGEKPAITKAGMDRIALAKDEGVRQRLDIFAANGARDMLHTLLLYCAFEDIRPSDRHRIGRTLVDDQGNPRQVSTDALCLLAAELIADRICFSSPKRFRNNGPAAEWLARAVGARVARVDDADTLRNIGGDLLRDIATAEGISTGGTVSALRKRLAGALPEWEPVPYGAPGPRAIGDEPPADEDEDEPEEDADEHGAKPNDGDDMAEDQEEDEDAASAD